MSYNGSSGDGGNVWNSGSRGGGGSRGGFRSYNDDDDNGSRGGSGSYRGSFGNNNNSRRGGGSYGFRRQNDSGDVQTLTDTIFIQNLPKNVTSEEIYSAFSGAGTIKTDDRSGGPKIWIFKDRETGEANGRATVTYEDDESADRAISQYNDQHIDSIDAVVRVQLSQRRPRVGGNDRGGGRGGYRGGRSNGDFNNPRQGFNSDDNRWGGSRGGFGDSRNDSGFRGNSGGDRDGSYHGGRGGGGSSYRGASRGNGGSSNYSPY